MTKIEFKKASGPLSEYATKARKAPIVVERLERLERLPNGSDTMNRLKLGNSRMSRVFFSKRVCPIDTIIDLTQKLGSAASLSIVKRRLKQPVKRTKRDIVWALGIVGIGEGPADLSQRARDYLYGSK